MHISKPCGETKNGIHGCCQRSSPWMICELIIEFCGCIYNSDLDSNYPVRPQCCTCQDYPVVVTCAELILDCIIRLYVNGRGIIMRFQLLSHKPFAKWERVTWTGYKNLPMGINPKWVELKCQPYTGVLTIPLILCVTLKTRCQTWIQLDESMLIWFYCFSCFLVFLNDCRYWR